MINYISGYYDFFDKLIFKKYINLIIKYLLNIAFLLAIITPISYLSNNSFYSIKFDLLFKTLLISIFLQFLFNALYFFKKKETWVYQNNSQLNDYIEKNSNLFKNEINFLCTSKIKYLNLKDEKVSGILYDNLDLELKKYIQQKVKPKIAFISLIQLCERNLRRSPPELITEKDLIQLSDIPSKNFYYLFKRMCDFIFSILLLILTLPFIFIIGILIKIEDGGPIFYTQIRSGLNEMPYRIIKLRSMIVNAEKDGPQWSYANDSRLTNIGKIIRALRLDELPQLLSVIKGDMSLIGPRPERPVFIENLSKEIPNYKLRSIVKPGLSGWAQVNYPYGSTLLDAENKLSYDIFYVKNISMPLDLMIFIKTIRIVFTAKGT